jgi:hypothetical protein
VGQGSVGHGLACTNDDGVGRDYDSGIRLLSDRDRNSFLDMDRPVSSRFL